MGKIYQLKIRLKGSKPPIWRRVLVSEDSTFYDLHNLIQISMNWDGFHLYEFRIDDDYFPMENIETGFSNFNLSKDKALHQKLKMQLNKPGTKIEYVYDFGDEWQHIIILEKVLAAEEGQQYPVCIGGKGACPPDDSGGILAYQQMLDVLKDKEHAEHELIKEWLGEDWDAEYFDMDEINTWLQESNQNKDTTNWRIPFPVFDEFEYTISPEIFTEVSSPQEVLNNPDQKMEIEKIILEALKYEDSPERITLERLLNHGLNETKACALIEEALAIEWFYEFKYGTDNLNDRYHFNLKLLPEPPVEIPRIKDAVDIIENSRRGIPFKAIEYLQNQPKKKVIDLIIEALKNAYNPERFMDDHIDQWLCTPIWYAIVAEAHIDERLIDPLIEMFKTNEETSDYLNEQGLFLIGQLSERYPDKVIPKVIEAVKWSATQKYSNIILFLYDALFFADPEKYEPQLLEVLKTPGISFPVQWAQMLSYLQIKSALPVMKNMIKEMEDEGLNDNYSSFFKELVEAAEELETGKTKDPAKMMMPYSKTRSNWREHYKNVEDYFDDSEEQFEDFENIPEEEVDYILNELFSVLFNNNNAPLIKGHRPGRNDPCYCGSGKKYKNCCLTKDQENDRIKQN